MLVTAPNPIVFPQSEWLSSRTAGPHNGRVLAEIRGHSGMSSWPEVLLTAPEDAFGIVEQDGRERLALLPGVYEVREGQDRRGRRLLRLYRSEARQADAVMFSVPGHLVLEASDPQAVEIARAEGRSRTGVHGNRWAFIAAPAGATIAAEPYGYDGDPVYYRVTLEGPVELGATDAVLAPDEW